MRYEKLHIACMFTEVWTNPKRSVGKMLRRSNQYFRVRSTLLGDCGHNHTSMDTARPCFQQMQARMKTRRAGD
jgi:hypothetical protein